MLVQQLLIVTAAGMLIVLAVSRLVRMHLGRSPHPAGRARLPFILGFLFLPPIVVEAAILHPTTSAAQLHVIESVLVYLAALVVFSILMGIAGLLVHLVVHGRSRRLLLVALVGSEVDSTDVPFDPALTPAIAESMALVDGANAVFPRGPGFAAEIDRTGFRTSWDALDAATVTLEGRIAEDHRLGVAVAAEASATARDARGRLDSLRSHAVDHGQVWAS